MVHISWIRPYVGEISPNARVSKQVDVRTEDVEGEEIVGGSSGGGGQPQRLSVPAKWIGIPSAEIVDKTTRAGDNGRETIFPAVAGEAIVESSGS